MVRDERRSAQYQRRVLLAIVLVAGTIAVWWLVARADGQLRAELLVRTRMAAEAVNVELIRALSGTDVDLESPDYGRLKEQLAGVRAADFRCRFVYLMGRRAEGQVFFYADSESSGCADESSAGLVYDRVSAAALRAFDTKSELTEGPIAGRRGTWISALVPLIDPETGELVAMLGHDADAGDWNQRVAARAAIPAGLVLLLMIGLTTAHVASGHVKASPRPVLRRLLPTMVILLVQLFVLAGALLWHQHRERLAERTALVANEAHRDLHEALAQQARGLTAKLRVLVLDDHLRRGLMSGDREKLLERWEPVFEIAHDEEGLTHFYLHGPDRVNLLRVHKPEKSGDRIDRFTMLEA